MKTYPFIVINKNNMTKLEHFARADCCALRILSKNTSRISDNFLVIKNENRIVDFSGLAPSENTFRKLKEALENA